jgi:Holliday junction resolvasome RuvABC endonuclease subunit
MNEATSRLLQDRLGTFRDKNQKIIEPKKPWQPPAMEDFAWDCRVQSMDQSLTNFGYVRFAIDEGIVIMLARDTIRPERHPELMTFTEHYELAWTLETHLLQVLFTCESVIEMPPVHGSRTESILLSGYAVYAACKEVGVDALTMISKNHVGAVLCGDPNASKKQIGEAVCRYIPEAVSRKWNEHTRDAAALGLTRLYDLKQEGVGG